MSGVFLRIVNMSISASWIVIVILLLRLLLKKAPKWMAVLLWGIVAVRLICPFSVESILSLIPSSETISKEPDANSPHFESGFAVIDDPINDYLSEHYFESAGESEGITTPPAHFEGAARPAGYFVDVTTVLAIVWIVGIAVLLVYTAISYLRVKRKIGTAVRLRDNIFQSENVVSPFVLGIIKPKVYLPFNIGGQDIDYVIAHEYAHIRRKDHWWKPFGFLVLALHWFNPLMWLGYVLLCRDIELACDEKVVKELDAAQKADYSQALLTCSVNRRVIAACPLAFGEVGVKNRVKSVLNYKKPAFWLIVVAILAGVAAAVCFLTDPVSSDGDTLNGDDSQNDEIITIQLIDEAQVGDYPTDAQYHDTNAPSQSWKIVVKATKDVTDFRFIELDESEAPTIGGTLFVQGTFKANSPVLLHTYINDAALNRGISYRDENGAVRYFGIEYSGRDGSISLKEIRVEDTDNYDWDITTLPKPTAVDQFDVAVLTHDTDVDIAGHTILYNGKERGKGYYSYLGEWDGRYYFRGIENYDEYAFICSCDKEYKDFQKHPDIAFMNGIFLYDGVFYSWKGKWQDTEEPKGLYAYDLRTKQGRLLLNKGQADGAIHTIADGWIVFQHEASVKTWAYHIETGRIVTFSEHIHYGILADGVLYGFRSDRGNKLAKPYELVALDLESDKMTTLAVIQNPRPPLLMDINGDIWVKDMGYDGTTVLKKVADGNGETALPYNPGVSIIDGWWYYRYRPEISDKRSYLARLNLKTGETEYCPNIDLTGLRFEVQPHYWGRD